MQVPFDVLVDGFNFVEAPRNAPDGSVYFSELIEGGLYRYSPDGSVATILSDRRWIGGLVINRDGSVICSGEGGLVRVYPETGRVEPLLTEVDGKPVIAINDIEAGPTGGIYGGTVDFKAILEDGTEPSPGAFFLLRPDGELRIIHRDLVASNGMGFSPDLRRLYHSESPKGVWVHELDDQGLPGDRKLAAITAFDKAIASGRLDDSAQAEVNFRLGELYVSLGQRERAITHFRAAARTGPAEEWGTQSQAYLNLLR